MAKRQSEFESSFGRTGFYRKLSEQISLLGLFNFEKKKKFLKIITRSICSRKTPIFEKQVFLEIHKP